MQGGGTAPHLKTQTFDVFEPTRSGDIGDLWGHGVLRAKTKTMAFIWGLWTTVYFYTA
jgi:hypothetical protein